MCKKSKDSPYEYLIAPIRNCTWGTDNRIAYEALIELGKRLRETTNQWRVATWPARPAHLFHLGLANYYLPQKEWAHACNEINDALDYSQDRHRCNQNGAVIEAGTASVLLKMLSQNGF